MVAGNNEAHRAMCLECTWWQLEPKAPIVVVTGKPARGEGSSEKPPTAAPAR